MAELIRFRINGKNGYKTRSGTVVVDPQFNGCVVSFGKDSVSRCPYGLVEVDDKYGVINEDGEIVIPIVYQEVIYLFDNLFAVRRQESGNDWSFGVLDDSNKIIVPFEYKYVASSGIFLFCYSESTSRPTYKNIFEIAYSSVYDYNYGDHNDVYNSSGKLIYKDQCRYARFSFLVIDDNGKKGIINSNGDIVLRPIYTDIVIARDDRFIVGIDQGESRDFFILDSAGNKITKNPYERIASDNGFFYHCDKSSNSKDIAGKEILNTNNDLNILLNAEGKIVHEGICKVLTNTLFSVLNNNKKIGIYNYEGNQVLNFQFDSVRVYGGKIVVVIEGRIGIVGSSGEIEVSPLYRSIEFVSFDFDEPIYSKYDPFHINFDYKCYYSEHIFDTNKPTDMLRRYIIETRFFYPNIFIINAPSVDISFDNTMILRGDDYAELFSIKDGIFQRSRFDEIYPINYSNYVVKSNSKCGVYSSESKSLIIECEYDRIVYEGGHVVLLYKDEHCGVKSLDFSSQELNSSNSVNVPVIFLDIKILDSKQSLFGVKGIRKDNDGNEYEEYTIVDSEGKRCISRKIWGITSQFKIYRRDRILCGSHGKYGFISFDGFITIPFIYDRIIERKDHNFDVCIENKWGVLSLDGKEIVAVKYIEPIPVKYANAIVVDALSNRKGILSESGDELIPSIYEHLVRRDGLLLFGCGGDPKEKCGYYLADIEDSKWGCLDNNGRVIIEPHYDVFNIQNNFILAGRGGIHLKSRRTNNYCGVFDLYDTSGELLIGGFSEFEFLEGPQLYKFLLGGEWFYDNSLLNEMNQIYDDEYDFDKRKGEWLITTKDFKSVKLTKDGQVYTFPNGTILDQYKIEDGETIKYWDCPLDILFTSEPRVIGDYLLTSSKKQSMAIRISDGKETNLYDGIEEHIQKGFFFVRSDKNVGLIDLEGNTIIPVEYVALTVPVNSFVFAIRELKGDKCNVDLLDLHAKNLQTHRAASNCEMFDVLRRLARGYYLIYENNSFEGLKSISTFDHSIYDEDFRSKINEKENGRLLDYCTSIYWFINDVEFIDTSSGYDNNYSDETDYAGDTWDAMTDGMNGDMPDGFDGDYDFLGH